MSGYSVAIVGVTGAVGTELLQCLERRNFPISEIRLLASKRSVGSTVRFRNAERLVEELAEPSLKGVDIAFFAVDNETARTYVPIAVRHGAVVIDNSSAYRLSPDIPLIIPEINPEAVRRHKGLIANPNCCAIIAITPLWPIHKKYKIRRLIISTYQAASGAGAPAMNELRESTKAFLEGQTYTPKVLPHPYAFNVFNHDSAVDLDSGYNGEELKIVAETRKIFSDPHIAISATCVRVPVLRAHAESLTFECVNPISPADVRALLEDAPGVKVVDDRRKNYFPMPIDASNQDKILVGRIRQDTSDPSGRSISMFVAGDQLLKGAALNAVQIAELFCAQKNSAAQTNKNEVLNATRQSLKTI